MSSKNRLEASSTKKTPFEIYQAVRKDGKGSGHGKRIAQGKELLRQILQEKRKKWSL